MTDEIKKEQKPIIIPRAVSIEEMLNIINDKIDWLIAKMMEEKKQ